MNDNTIREMCAYTDYLYSINLKTFRRLRKKCI